ncbi:uncharacterized protein LOC120273431 isoform X2 [Dioscorea cayenensis subsp. rotundata]|uniref:Uncharacterized protein LOC120273431 isoform X2 n=1 Tax=Dioscorea cayennensis subsp. rotundata TaxID=55577 RepID=A0AB40CB28_DIOCR|nr:uncharacterized protein LOC120273431 isoform X2 [Dioscorea cayenensis subsp. rotundata]
MNFFTSFTSSPSLSSSSTTDALEVNVSDTGMGCLTGIMSRLLCHNAAREAIREAKQVSRELCNEAEKKPAPSPGLVARLMGLDSMPVFPYTPPSSMGRSRSTSSLESWPLFLSGERCNEKVKMRTSVSFREAPTFLRQENEDFLLLTFTSEPSEEKDMKELKQVKEMRREKVNRREEKKNKHKGRQINEELLSSKHKQRVRRKAVESVRTVKKMEVEVDFNSQNSSPDSVLDNAFGIDNQCYDKKLVKRRSRKKLSSELDCLQLSTPKIKFNVVVDDGGLISQSEDRDRNYRMKKHEKPRNGSPELWELVCRFADEDVKRSNWFSTEKCKSEDAEEIVFITALHILDCLLHEVVNELYLN